MDKEQKEGMALQAELKRLSREQQEEDDSYKDKVTDFESIKKEVRQALLGLEIQKEWVETKEGGHVMVEYVRTKEGIWKPLYELGEKEKEELMSKGWMNEEGAQDVINILNLLSNSVVGLSDLKTKEAGKVGYKISVGLTDQTESNMDKYDIESYEDLSLILNLLDGIVVSILGGSREGAKLRHLAEKEQIRRIETSDSSGKSRIKNLFS